MVDREQLDRLRADRTRLESVLREAGATFQGGKVRCPFHPDRTPSAGVHELDGGGWRFTCHSCDWNGGKKSGDVFDVTRRFHGCDFKAACAKLGLNGSPSSNGRAKPAKASVPASAIERSAPGATIDASQNEIEAQTPPGRTFPSVEAYAATLGDRHGGTWHYPNLDGSPAMAVVRINEPTPDDPAKKRFMPLHPTPDGWAIGDPPGKLPVYRLPDLAAADVVHVCEGEKAADAARAIGLVATTSSHGSGAADKTDWMPLAGKRVVILPDNDDPGRKYAASVKKILAGLNPPALDVRIVELPGLSIGGDIADYIDARECVDSEDIVRGIQELVDVADPWHGTSIGDLWRSTKTWAPVTYIKTGFPWLDARLAGGIRTRGPSVIAGKTGQGKTQLAVACATNAARAGFPTAILSLELTASAVAKLIACQLGEIPRNALDTGRLQGEYGKRLRDVQGQFSGLPLSILDYGRWSGGLTREVCGKIIADGVKRFGWRMVVLDYLGLLVPSEIDRDQYDTDIRHSTELKRLADVHDIALVAIAATRKGAEKRTIENMTADDVLGAGRLCYDSQLVLGVGCKQGDASCGLIKVRTFKNRYGPCGEADPPVSLRWHPNTGAIVHLPYEEAGETEAVIDGSDDDFDPAEEAAIADEIRKEISGDVAGEETPF